MTSFLEVVGVGIVGPFISIATNPVAIHQNLWASSIYSGLHLTSDSQFISVFGLGIIIIFYIKVFINFSSQKYIFEFGYNQQAEIALRLMKAYMTAPYTFHLKRNSADLIQNINNETNRFANGLMMPLLTSVSNALISLALLCLMIKTDPLAFVTIIGVLMIAFMGIYALKNPLKRWGQESSEAGAKIIQAINHGLGGLKETKVIGCESYFENQLHEQVKKYGVSTSLANSFSNLPRYMIEAFLVTFLILFTIIFISTNKDPQNLNSVLGIFAIASIRLLPSVSNLTSSINGIRYNAFSLDKIYFDFQELANENNKILDLSCGRMDSLNNKELSSFGDRVSLNNIHYRYPNAANIALENVSMTIRKGQSIGLIGKSGAGKTTLVDIILGLLAPESGDITVDGVSIYPNLRSWQNMLGYVPQSIFLTDDTLQQNIAFGVPNHLIDPDRLWRAVEVAQLSDYVKQLPQGLETKVGERGVLLSGGQRQRVGIARAIYHEREVLVFDEATAALDNETEALVTESIKSLSGTKTIIIIAHRLTTIEHCDIIYLLDKGTIVKSGNYEEVTMKR
ncbi:ABC transporter ATP-binding protein [Chamaesiphon polymorphus]|uniref:ABC transporter ATP-binding protein n=1 Tax=Chamaesiphon polymorphus TaxID=2107691 RepID=UPI001FED0D18|nr:ABC transporter ATP-binding protein [Chamaesiphon polymorphus]